MLLVVGEGGVVPFRDVKNLADLTKGLRNMDATHGGRPDGYVPLQ